MTAPARVTSLAPLVALCAIGCAPLAQPAPWLRPVDRLAASAEHAFDLAMTGDGAFVVVARRDHVEVLPVGDGAPWRVPDVGGFPHVAAFGGASRFAAVDERNLVIADARAREVVQRVALASIASPPRWDWRIAMAPDGARCVLSSGDAHGRRAGWLLDLATATATPTPIGPAIATWAHDGFVLLHGQPGSCGVLLDARWTWLPAAPPAPPEAPEAAGPRPSRVWYDDASTIAALPGRRELVHPFPVEGENEDDFRTTIGRFDPTTGALLAGRTTEHGMVSPVRVVAGHVVALAWLPDTLQLRRADDLELIGEVALPAGQRPSGAAAFVAAEHAPRIAVWLDDTIRVYDVATAAAPAPRAPDGAEHR